ncbi:hypothetical protein ACFOHS_08490 [Jhaorihella thermophila]
MTTNIRLGERGARRGHHLPQELTPDAILPAAEVRGEDVEKGYSALWDGFKTAWNEAARRCAADPVAFEEAVLSLSERFLWSVPSSTVDQPDVSLHDHSHAVAAFASALFRFHQSRRKTVGPVRPGRPGGSGLPLCRGRSVGAAIDLVPSSERRREGAEQDASRPVAAVSADRRCVRARNPSGV